MIQVKDSLEFLKEQKDFSIDINYSDPPYALGSEIIIRPDGKVDYKKANDFMSKWKMPTGEYWEQWFKEAYRSCKYGGYVIMFGMDRQLLLFKYYAQLAGLVEKQSMYWYFISNFPKATDLSKMIDKNAGAEREKLGEYSAAHQSGSDNWNGNDRTGGKGSGYKDVATITAPSTPLAKKYSGYKYSIAPLKQTNETIMVFQKPYKTGSCLHDTLAYENGDESVTCGALDIDGNRVDIDFNSGGRESSKNTIQKTSGISFNGNVKDSQNTPLYNTSGRYPSQTFCDSGTAEVLDKQSGISKNNGHWSKTKVSGFGEFGNGKTEYFGVGEKDTGESGCSKILHKCDYEDDEHDLFLYNPKVSKSERNVGCDELEDNTLARSGGAQNAESKGEEYLQEGHTGLNRISVVKNNHPTLKPIKLNERILRLFKTPNPQTIIYPFAGSGSEIIGGYKAGFTDWEGCELNPEYVDIANARIKHWCK